MFLGGGTLEEWSCTIFWFDIISDWKGELFAFVSALSFALASIAVAKGMMRTKGDNGELLSVLVTALFSGLLWLALGVQPVDAALWETSKVGIAWLALSGILTTVAGRIFFYRSIHELGVVRAAAVKRVNPFFSVILAAAVLGEVISVPMGLGMAMIGASFVMLIAESWTVARHRSVGSPPTHAPLSGYFKGTVSGLSYATGYIARKTGLATVPDAALGTLISSMAAIIYYTVMTIFVSDYRRAFRDLLRRPNFWQVVGAVFISIGQISLFFALQFAPIAQVVMIGSIETFLSMLLATAVFRTEGLPGATALVATLLATLGVIFVAVG